MSEFFTERKEKCGVFFMTAVAEASSLLRAIAEPRPIGDSVKAAINRAARAAGLSASRTEDIWRQEAKAIRAEEMDAIRLAAARRAAGDAKMLEEARAEYRRLKARLASLEQAYRISDPDFHRDQIDALVGPTVAPDRPLD